MCDLRLLNCFRSLKCYSAIKDRPSGREGTLYQAATSLQFPGHGTISGTLLLPFVCAVITNSLLTIRQLPMSLLSGLFPLKHLM